jgi:hypothetical protein
LIYESWVLIPAVPVKPRIPQAIKAIPATIRVIRPDIEDINLTNEFRSISKLGKPGLGR